MQPDCNHHRPAYRREAKELGERGEDSAKAAGFAAAFGKHARRREAVDDMHERRAKVGDEKANMMCMPADRRRALCRYQVVMMKPEPNTERMAARTSAILRPIMPPESKSSVQVAFMLPTRELGTRYLLRVVAGTVSRFMMPITDR